MVCVIHAEYRPSDIYQGQLSAAQEGSRGWEDRVPLLYVAYSDVEKVHT